MQMCYRLTMIEFVLEHQKLQMLTKQSVGDTKDKVEWLCQTRCTKEDK